MRRAVGPLLLLAGCAGLSEADRALLDGPIPPELPGAWVVWARRDAEEGAAVVLAVERDGKAWAVSRLPHFSDSLAARMSPPRKPRLREERREGVLSQADVAFLDAALRAPPPAAPSGRTVRWQVVVREPDRPERRFSYAVPAEPEGPRAMSALETAFGRVALAIRR